MSSEQAIGEQTGAATKARPLVDPSDFQLKGDGVTISYSTTSFTGAPQFHYKDAAHDLNVSGDEIAAASSPAGELVTTTLQRSFVAPPGPSGVLQTYRLHKLHSEARKLDF